MSTTICAAPTPSRVARITRPRRTVLAAALAAAALALSGCGLRLETPPPVEPSPDALEQVRARTVGDALALQAAAQDALATTTDEVAEPLLNDVVTFSAQHVAALGGRYDSGIEPGTDAEPGPDGEPTATPSVAPTAAAVTAQDVLALLGDTTTTAGTDADSTADGPLARLVGAIAVSRADLTDRLAAALGEDSSGPALPEAVVVPPEVDVAVAGPLALAHDEAGYALEVVAARGPAETRKATLAAARTHRAAGESWASAAGVAGTEQDPRLAQYGLPTDLDQDGALNRLAVAVQDGIARASTAALAAVPAGARDTYLDGLRLAVHEARTLGAPPAAFPGLPEQTEPAQPQG
ncbi:DUF4439 domain-containing protein [Cellulomonas persica]|uniref:DUF4439 domain-containing protein n=1 Tax=Cellulomonas persica TaxID=76861 RepID=A0A510US21_9CELL|nr:DUF4439 domain-containing protein [Cellulomonas persica]GEK16271.1 hypothetical protein CPE01_00040 [Cellulomonas persica]